MNFPRYKLILFFLSFFSVFFSQEEIPTGFQLPEEAKLIPIHDSKCDSSIHRHEFNNQNTCSYDFLYSHLKLEFLLSEKKIIGSNDLYFQTLEWPDTIDIDLAGLMIVDSIYFKWIGCEEVVKSNFIRDDNKILIPTECDGLPCFLHEGDSLQEFMITVFYQGKPKIAQRAPWDGGFVWSLDSDSLHWIGVACQNQGASLWWPTQEALVAEPHNMRMSFIVEEPYFIVSNGQLDTIRYLSDQKRLFDWVVNYPINNYNVTVNIGDYENFQDTLMGKYGLLNMHYYVLPKNLDLAKTHFEQVNPMMHFFENKFGPFPFYKDGYKLVETPYLGMEHQTCIAYGNQYQKGYLGLYPKDIDFDFIIIHETAHEWWGNSISMEHRRDMWIHESFATYSEALYVEHFYGYDDMLIYLEYQKTRILNQEPIVNESHSTTDMYYKGSWMLHTLRNVLQNDSIWDDILQGLQAEFKYQTVNTHQIIKYIERKYDHELSGFFQQYLFETQLPSFEYFIKKRRKKYFLHFRWRSQAINFDMPLLAKINNNNGYTWIYPTQNWQKIELTDISSNDFQIAESLFLIDIVKVK